jgi:hypothetical protein
MRISVLGVDLGENGCSLVGLDAAGGVVLRRRAKRAVRATMSTSQASGSTSFMRVASMRLYTMPAPRAPSSDATS